MEKERQQAIDYLMGSLNNDEKSSFEALLETDESTKQLVAEISDDWSSLALLAKPSTPDSDLRSRTLMLLRNLLTFPHSWNQKELKGSRIITANRATVIWEVKER